MVTFNAFDPEILEVHLMVKRHFTYRGGKESFRRYLRGVSFGRRTGSNKKNHRRRCEKKFDHNYLVTDIRPKTSGAT
jgi:hypothetical protein